MYPFIKLFFLLVLAAMVSILGKQLLRPQQGVCALNPDSGNELTYQFVINSRVTGWEYGEIYKKLINKPIARLYSLHSLLISW